MENREIALRLSGVKKMYRLGQIGGGTLQGDLQSWWARVRGREDPNTKIGTDQRLVGKTFMALNGIDLTVYKGEALASNQNVNKGLYNGNFSSVVSVYKYDASGKLIDSMSYEVEHPKSKTPIEGDLLFGKNGQVYTVGTVTEADGGRTETVLTVYKGQYVAFANAIKNVSDHLIGLIQYFDAE